MLFFTVSLLLSDTPPSSSPPSSSCCAHWTGMIASVSGSMRTLFKPCILNTPPPPPQSPSLPTPPFLISCSLSCIQPLPSHFRSHFPPCLSIIWAGPYFPLAPLTVSIALCFPLSPSSCRWQPPSIYCPFPRWSSIIDTHPVSTCVRHDGCLLRTSAISPFLCPCVCVSLSLCVHTFMREINITVCVWTIWVMYIIPQSTRQ